MNWTSPLNITREDFTNRNWGVYGNRRDRHQEVIRIQGSLDMNGALTAIGVTGAGSSATKRYIL